MKTCRTKKEQYRWHVCFYGADDKVQTRSERVKLCLCGSRESLRQSTEGGTVVLYMEVWSEREVCETNAGDVWEQYDSDEVSCRSDGWLRGRRRAASRIGPEPLLISCVDGQTDKWGQVGISVDYDVCRSHSHLQ